MRLFYTDQFVLPLPVGHRFPMEKYAMLREQVVAMGLVSPAQLHVPPAATNTQLLLAHDVDYLRRVVYGTLTRQAIRRIGFPWTPEMVERSRRSVGATIAACRAALHDGVAANLAGGTHHAFYDQGEGYCVFNDVVVAARTLQAEGSVQRVVIIDCDVHQGNGTAALCANDARIFTLSVHGAKNFPFRKQQSNLDIALDDDTGDEAYLAAVAEGVSEAVARAQADLALYVSGADPFVGDTLGRLAVSKEGLAARDASVLHACRAAGLPVAITMAGGYARQVQDTVDIHLQTIRTAVEMQPSWRAQQGVSRKQQYQEDQPDVYTT
jgi:acetoin utilization deacetylase AcuC-like enzyme